MSAIEHVSPSRSLPALTGDTRRHVSGQYARWVLAPGILAILLTPLLGLDWVVFAVVPDYETAKDVSNGVSLAQLVVGGVLYVVAVLHTVRFGRRYREDRRHHVSNGSRAWHIGSIVLLVVLTVIPVMLVLGVIALAFALAALNSGL
jgi:uncharacterized membrane protein YidH (DUF202 family)